MSIKIPEEIKLKNKKLSRETGAFIINKKPLKSSRDFRLNKKCAEYVEFKGMEDLIEVKYMLGINEICIDTDNQEASDEMQAICAQLGIFPYNYETSPGHNHWWFRVNQYSREFIDRFKHNSNSHTYFGAGTDSRALRYTKEEVKEKKIDKKTGEEIIVTKKKLIYVTGAVYLKQANKLKSGRPSPTELVSNLKTLPDIPIWLLAPKVDKWYDGNFNIHISNIKKPGEGRYAEEITYACAFKNLGFTGKCFANYMIEQAKFRGDKRPNQSFSEEYWLKIYEDSYQHMENESKKLFDKDVIRLKNKIMGTNKWIHYKQDIYGFFKGKYESLINSYKYKEDVKKQFRLANEEAIKDEPLVFYINKNNHKIYSRDIALRSIWDDLLNINNITDEIEDCVVGQNFYITKDKGLQFDMENAPFTFNVLPLSYDSKSVWEPTPAVLEKFLTFFLGDKVYINGFFRLSSYALCNYTNGVGISMSGPSNIGKGTWIKLVSKVIGMGNLAPVISGSIFTKSGDAFSETGLRNNLLAAINEKEGYVDETGSNRLKTIIDDNPYIFIRGMHKETAAFKNSCSIMIFSNSYILFDTFDNALMNRLVLIDRFKEDEESFQSKYKLNSDEIKELFSEKTIQWLFNKLVDMQVEEIKNPNLNRNENYILDMEMQKRYISKIRDRNPLVEWLLNKLYHYVNSPNEQDYKVELTPAWISKEYHTTTNKKARTIDIVRILEGCGFEKEKGKYDLFDNKKHIFNKVFADWEVKNKNK